MIAINPKNKHQGRLFFCLLTANDEGETRHPSVVMRELEISHDFKIIDEIPKSMADGWDFWIEFENKPDLPNYFRGKLEWKPIGEI